MLGFVALINVLLNTVHASSEIGTPRSCAVFIVTVPLCDEDLHDFLNLCPSCAVQLHSPINDMVDWPLSSLWLGCCLLCVPGLVLCAIYRAQVSLRYSATRASSSVDRSSPQINGAPIPAIVGDSPQVGSQEAAQAGKRL